MSSDERRARKQAREQAQREQYEENVRHREDDRRRQQEERLTELEYHRNRSGEYLYGIYRWVRFGGIVLIIFLILTLLVGLDVLAA